MTPVKPPAWRRYVVFWGSDTASDVDDELRFHLEMRALEYTVRGHPPDAARRRAEQRFGSVERARDACIAIDSQHARAESHMQLLIALSQDAAYALRVLRRQWIPACAAILCMAIGISATTAMFSVTDTLLLRPLPYPNGERLVMINTARGHARDGTVSSYADFLDWRAGQHSFDDIGALAQTNFVMQRGEPRRVASALVSASFFPTFGITAELGRIFTDADDKPGATPVLVVSDAFAREQFGQPDRALGERILLNGAARTIVGVIPDEWRYPSRGEAWLPITTGGYSGYSAGVLDASSRGNRNLEVFGVLRRPASIDAARADLAAIADRLQKEYPGSNAEMTTMVVPLRERYVGDIRGSLVAVIGATLLVLLIACANVAALQLARAAARSREIAVRAAVGASRGRIVRQLLTESVLLSLIGGALGALLAVWARDLIRRAVAPNTPAWMTFDIDARALLFALIVSAAAGIAFGIAPALRLADIRAGSALRNATVGSSRSRLQQAFVIAQVAISIMLVVSASLALQSVWRIQRIPLGIDPNDVATFEVDMQAAGRYDTPAARALAVAEIERRLRALPGVVDAGAADRMPINGCCSLFKARIEGQTVSQGHEPLITGTIATPGYFSTLHVHLVAGRAFTASDDANAPPVTMINQTFANKYWPHGDALGHRVNTGVGPATIVGIVEDVKQATIFGAPEPQFFRPYAQDPWTRATFAIRARRDLAQVTGEARRAVRAVDPTMPIFNAQTLQEVFDDSTLTTRSLSGLLVAFAVIALVLAAAGLYGVISFLVERRTREFGLRIALGAEPGRVAAMVVRQAFALAAVGAFVGLGGAALGAKWLAATLYGITPREPAVYAAAAAILTAAALAASYGPARRASRADPMDALRGE